MVDSVRRAPQALAALLLAALTLVALLASAAAPADARRRAHDAHDRPDRGWDRPGKGHGHGHGPRPGRPGDVAFVPSTPENVVWGGFPIDAPPVASVRSGQVVKIDTLSHAGATSTELDPVSYLGRFGVKPWEVLRDARDFWASIPNRTKYGGGHILTGPIQIDGAEPGDTLEIQILDIKQRVPYGINNTGPESGVFAPTYPGWRAGDSPLDIPAPPIGTPAGLYPDVRQHLYRTGVEHGRQVAYFEDDIHVPLQEFMGIMAVASPTGVFVPNRPGDPPPADGVQHSTPPGPFGGNLDTHDLGRGATLYLPVFQPGALFYTGDPHSVQGDGEVSGTAIEHSLSGTFRFVLHKGRTIPGPIAQDGEHWITMGIDHDLDRAMKLSVAEMLRFLTDEKGLTVAKAYSLASIAGDFAAAEVVDRTQVVSGKLDKSLFGD